MPLPGKQKTIAFPFIRALIASISHSGALTFGATVFTLNPLAIKISSLHYYFTPLSIHCQYESSPIGSVYITFPGPP